MSEILLRLNPETGNIEKIQLIADDEESQLNGIKRLQLYLKDINQFSRNTAESARLYNMFNGEGCHNETGN